jgi:hypothetical protein
LKFRSFRLVHFLTNKRSRERNERMAKVRRSMGERSRRWHYVTGSSEDLLADIPALRESFEELRKLSTEIQKLETRQVHYLAEARILTAKIRALAKRADHLRGRVGASLRGKHGFDSPELSRYGFKPREWVNKDHADRALEREREERKAEGEAPSGAPEG